MSAKVFINDMLETSHMFCPHAAVFLSNNDKGQAPPGLVAASLQAPMLLHLSCKVRLLDHDFVVGERHKLIPSVYGAFNITNNSAVNYSIDTVIRIRSRKHDKSSAESHANDIHELFWLDKISQKSILLMETDGTQDEAPLTPNSWLLQFPSLKNWNWMHICITSME